MNTPQEIPLGAAAPDAISIELVRGSLRSIQGEMEALIERTALSAFIREKKDLHAAIFDAHGRAVVTKSLPLSSDLLEPIFELYPAHTMRKGDLYWYNDCYASRGAISHSPDQVIIAPVFHGGSIVGYVQSWAHFGDVGGLHAGSISPQCTEIFHEGIIVPPCRLAAAGSLNEDLLRMFTRNSRFPEAARGDMNALIAAVRVGEQRMQELAARFGPRKLQAALDQQIERSHSMVQSRFRALVPSGSYRFADTIDTDGHGSTPIYVRWQLDVSPERIVMDGSGCDDQVRGPVNYLMSITEPALTLASYLLGETNDYMLNAGAAGLFDEVKLREGSILRPRFPAALGQRGMTKQRNMACYLGLLGVATGGNAPAAQSAYVIMTVRGRDLEGEPFLMSDGVAVGWGARPTADGHDAVYLVAQENYPVEFVEASYPLRLKTYGVRCDSGGPGRWRGGCGVVREFEVMTDEVSVALRIDNVLFPPWGTNGGQSAASGCCTVNPGTPDERALPVLSDGNILKRGEVLRLETGGGGGWGHPFDREPSRVLADVLGGFVSPAAARSAYGVALRADGRAVDEAETARLRATRPAHKMFHRREYMDSLR